MKRLIRLAARLYPKSWRQRYATEFEALLEDVPSGWRELFDILNGAVTMRIRTLGTIPVVCAVAGALVGALYAARTPELYASSATILLDESDIASAPAPDAERIRASLRKALGESREATAYSFVTLHRGDSAQTIKVTYMDRDPIRAQRITATLAAAVVAANGARAPAEVIDSPAVPAWPLEPDYWMKTASGGSIGLVAGAVFVLLRGSRQRPASAR